MIKTFVLFVIFAHPWVVKTFGQVGLIIGGIIIYLLLNSRVSGYEDAASRLRTKATIERSKVYLMSARLKNFKDSLKSLGNRAPKNKNEVLKSFEKELEDQKARAKAADTAASNAEAKAKAAAAADAEAKAKSASAAADAAAKAAAAEKARLAALPKDQWTVGSENSSGTWRLKHCHGEPTCHGRPGCARDLACEREPVLEDDGHPRPAIAYAPYGDSSKIKYG